MSVHRVTSALAITTARTATIHRPEIAILAGRVNIPACGRRRRHRWMSISLVGDDERHKNQHQFRD
jgi:hypothetical protein